MKKRPKEDFTEKFPNLAKELGGKGTVKINAVRSSQSEAEKATYTESSFEPTVVDFIRRCATDEEALEIINYLEAKGEVDEDYAKRLRRQLAEHGLGSFGERKEPGYYERAAKG